MDWHRLFGLALQDFFLGSPFAVEIEVDLFGAAHYRQRSIDTSTLIATLFEHYQLEGLAMPYTMEEFKREFLREHLDELPPEERLKGLPPEERLKGLPPEERLKGLPPEERLKGMSLEELARVLSREQIEAMLEKKRKTEGGI